MLKHSVLLQKFLLRTEFKSFYGTNVADICKYGTDLMKYGTDLMKYGTDLMKYGTDLMKYGTDLMFVLWQNKSAWFFNGTVFVPSLISICQMVSVAKEWLQTSKEHVDSVSRLVGREPRRW